MKKIFTFFAVTGALLLPSVTKAAEADYATQFAWDTPLILGNGTVLEIPQADSETPVYIQTNSQTELSNFLFTDSTCENPVSFDDDEIITTEDGLVYTKTLLLNWFSYYVKYSGTPVTFTFVKGTYDQEESYLDKATPIDWNTEITPGVRGDVYYSFKGTGEQAVIITNDSDNDLSYGGDPLLYYKGLVAEPVNVTSTLTPDGYIYTTPVLEDGVDYVLFFFSTTKFSFRIVEAGEVEVPDPEPIQISTGSEVTMSAKDIYYYTATQSGTLKVGIVATMGDAEWPETTLVYTSKEHDTPLANVTVNGTSYQFEVTEGESYYFYFTEPSWIVASVIFELPVEYMDSLPTLEIDNDETLPSAVLYWNEVIQYADEEATSVAATLVTPNSKEVEVSLALTSYWPDAVEGDQVAGDNALILPLGTYISEYGEGEYTLKVPAEVVMNEDGKYNNAIDETFTFNYATKPSLEAIIAVSADQIVISWENETIELYNPGNDDIQIMPADYSSEAVRLNVGQGVSVSETSITIDLTSLDIVKDVEYELIVPEDFVQIGEEKVGNEMIDYTFTALASAISAIGDEMGKAAIYNLQGVKVANPTKGGIYIINGKKVILK